MQQSLGQLSYVKHIDNFLIEGQPETLELELTLERKRDLKKEKKIYWRERNKVSSEREIERATYI
jgi:hypothetical protein